MREWYAYLFRLSYPKELELELERYTFLHRCVNRDIVAFEHPTVPESQSCFLESSDLVGANI